MKRLYIDTNTIVDAVEGRSNIFGKDMGNPASDLFLQAISCKYQLVISTWTLYELKCSADVQKSTFFEMLKKKTMYVTYSKEEMDKAKERSTNNNDDALHVIIAERENVDYIITRNTNHFAKIKTDIPVKKPEKLL